jgi:hypothetical protein
MPYYDTIEEDLARAKAILAEGRSEQLLNPMDRECSPTVVNCTIYGKDIYAAYKLLESFVQEIERLRRPTTSWQQLIQRLRGGCEYDPETKMCSETRWRAADVIEGLLREVRDLREERDKILREASLCPHTGEGKCPSIVELDTSSPPVDTEDR